MSQLLEIHKRALDECEVKSFQEFLRRWDSGRRAWYTDRSGFHYYTHDYRLVLPLCSEEILLGLVLELGVRGQGGGVRVARLLPPDEVEPVAAFAATVAAFSEVVLSPKKWAELEALLEL